MIRITTPNTKHLYEVSADVVGQLDNPLIELGRVHLEVEANSRAQAAKIARNNGYEVRDINMVG